MNKFAIKLESLLLEARAQETTAMLALPHYVTEGLVTQDESEQIRQLCLESIAVIDKELAKVPM